MSAALHAVRCRTCGGAVAAVPGKPLPACLFCGADAADLVAFEPEGIEPPEGAIPFAVLPGDAQETFAKFASSSFWYPNDLRNAKLELKRLLLPSWAWTGRVETYWTGLVRASTSSGKAPVAGQETADFEQILVPASSALTLAELASLGPYDETALAPWDPAGTDDPYEVSELTRSAARAKGLAEMERRHGSRIAKQNRLVKLKASSIALSFDGRPVLVPVYIGAYRYGDRVFRVLVNGQTGHLRAEAPKSVWKILGVIAAVLLAILLIAMCVGGFFGLIGLGAALGG